jgi:hypothetical protein
MAAQWLANSVTNGSPFLNAPRLYDEQGDDEEVILLSGYDSKVHLYRQVQAALRLPPAVSPSQWTFAHHVVHVCSLR